MTLTSARRLCLHAAELLERRGKHLRMIHTQRGEWFGVLGAYAAREHTDLLATARGLRTLAKGKQ